MISTGRATWATKAPGAREEGGRLLCFSVLWRSAHRLTRRRRAVKAVGEVAG